MAIVHDAWLFDPEAFAKRTIGLAQTVADQPAAGYRAARTSAIAALDQSGWDLVERYGGWDRASIIEELPEEAPKTREDVAFCFTLVLYSQLPSSEAGASLGLHTRWRDCIAILEQLHWTRTERELLVKGHDFGVLVDRYLAENGLTEDQLGETRRIWKAIRPTSTGASAGWLGFDDVHSLLRKLHEDESGLLTSNSAPGRAGTGDLSAYQKARAMLQSAVSKKCGLCLILSG